MWTIGPGWWWEGNLYPNTLTHQILSFPCTHVGIFESFLTSFLTHLSSPQPPPLINSKKKITYPTNQTPHTPPMPPTPSIAHPLLAPIHHHTTAPANRKIPYPHPASSAKHVFLIPTATATATPTISVTGTITKREFTPHNLKRDGCRAREIEPFAGYEGDVADRALGVCWSAGWVCCCGGVE